MDLLSKKKKYTNWQKKWLTSMLIVAVSVEFLVILYFLNFLPWTSDFHSKKVQTVAGFQYKDTITCNIAYTTYKNNTGLILPNNDKDQFIVEGLDTDALKLVLDDKVSINSKKYLSQMSTSLYRIHLCGGILTLLY